MPRVVRTRPAAHMSKILCIVMAIVAIQLVTTQSPTTVFPGTLTTAPNAAPSPAAAVATALRPAPPTATVTATATVASPSPAPAPPAAMVATPASVAATPAPAPTDPDIVPAVGQATAWGCAAALAYLQAYAAKGYALECPGSAEGQEAMTCMREAGACPTSAVIAIADPCPQAYMNEASNSYVILGVSHAAIDPYGPCP